MNNVFENQLFYWTHMLDEAFEDNDKSNDTLSRKYYNRAIHAKSNKYDEFYTLYNDATILLEPFKQHFIGKNILMPCDNYNFSEMFKLMQDNFYEYGINTLSVIGYGCDQMAVFIKDTQDIDFIPVENNGDFTTGESIEALKACDIVIANPPFSNQTDEKSGGFINTFFGNAIENGKDVIGIAPKDSFKYKKIKPYIINHTLNVINCPYNKFKLPDGSFKQVACFVYTTFQDIHKYSDKDEISFNDKVIFSDLPQVPGYKLYGELGGARITYTEENKKDGSISITNIPNKPGNGQYYIFLPYSVLGYYWEKYFKINSFESLNTTIGKKKINQTTYILMKYL